MAKAQADARALASAVSIYSAHVGNLPSGGTMTVLTTQVTNGLGQVGGPFMNNIPAAPTGWTAYAYTTTAGTGTFTITSGGDGTTVSIP
ncbi:MAG: type II secretion system protein GspG [Actinomycetota bacterium]|nr:type II secretion system protein GspG [Actinomycetota bacterium]